MVNESEVKWTIFTKMDTDGQYNRHESVRIIGEHNGKWAEEFNFRHFSLV